MAQKKLEIGADFKLHDIRAFANKHNYPMVVNTGLCTIYNTRGQYTQFQYYDGYWYCSVLWNKITNPNNRYYLRGDNDVNIYE